ncbi:MAG: ATP-binding protein [Patescibacteria group bacterium]
MNTPFLVLIDGPMGSGKTTTSKLLNQELPDTARVALPDIKRLIPNYRENEKTLGVVREVMKAMIDTYLSFGVSIIVEQITKTEGVEALSAMAEKHGARFYAYRLTAPKNIRLERVHERTREMMDVSELPESKIQELAGYFEPNNRFYLDNPIAAAESIDTQDLSPDQVVEAIIKKVS